MTTNVGELRYARAAHAQLSHPRPLTSGSHGHEQNGHAAINVGEFERHLSMVGGTVLAVCGLLRGSLSGLALGAIGGALIWRGHTGHCSTYQMLGYSSAGGCELAGEPEARVI